MQSRKVGVKGSITIPKELRSLLHLDGSFMQVETNDIGQIILTPFRHTCWVCGDINPTEKVMGRYMCESCYARIQEEMNNGDR